MSEALDPTEGVLPAVVRSFRFSPTMALGPGEERLLEALETAAKLAFGDDPVPRRCWLVFRDAVDQNWTQHGADTYHQAVSVFGEPALILLAGHMRDAMTRLEASPERRDAGAIGIALIHLLHAGSPMRPYGIELDKLRPLAVSDALSADVRELVREVVVLDLSGAQKREIQILQRAEALLMEVGSRAEEVRKVASRTATVQQPDSSPVYDGPTPSLDLDQDGMLAMWTQGDKGRECRSLTYSSGNPSQRFSPTSQPGKFIVAAARGKACHVTSRTAWSRARKAVESLQCGAQLEGSKSEPRFTHEVAIGPALKSTF